MSVFLFTTLLTFAALFLNEISQPAWPARGRTQARLGTHEQDGWPRPRITRGWAIFILATLLVVSTCGLLTATFRWVHPEVGLLVSRIDAFTGRNAPALLFGVVTGGLMSTGADRFEPRPTDPPYQTKGGPRFDSSGRYRLAQASEGPVSAGSMLDPSLARVA